METNTALSSARYTPRMQRLLPVAQEKAQDTIGAPVIGTEHMLFALAGDPDGIAGQILDELGVRARVIDRLEEIMASVGYRTPSREPGPRPS